MLSPTEIKLLKAINTTTRNNIYKLSRMINITYSTVSKSKKKLLRLNLITEEKEQRNNRRGLILKLTNKGQRALELTEELAEIVGNRNI